MKKLLICVSLLLVLVCAVVACKNTGNNEETTPATSESVTESGTAEPNNETSNNLDPTPTEPVPAGDDTTVPGKNNDTTVEDDDVTTEPETTEPETTKDPDEPVAIFNPEDIKNIVDENPKVGNGTAGIKKDNVAVTDNYITLVASGDDPHMDLYMDGSNPMEGARYVAIKYRTTVESRKVEVFIATAATYDPANGNVQAPAINDGKWHLLIIDLDTLSAVEDYKIGAIRFDFLQDAVADGDSIDIQFFAFFNSEEAAKKYSTKTDAAYHSSIDYVNGTGPDGQANYAGRGGSTITGSAVVDVIEDKHSPLDNNTITIKGWFACAAGVEKYVYTVDGANWFDCGGTMSDSNDAIYGASQGVPGLKDADKASLIHNGTFDLAADLSTFAGQTVSVTFGAVPANADDKVIPFVTIADVKVTYTNADRHGLYFDAVSSLDRVNTSSEDTKGISINNQLQNADKAGEYFLNMTVKTAGPINMYVKGWAGYENGKPVSLAYSIDGAKAVALENALSEATPDVTADAMAGANGFRFEFTFPTDKLEVGTHTLEMIIVLEDGTCLSGFTLTYVVVEPQALYTVDFSTLSGKVTGHGGLLNADGSLISGKANADDAAVATAAQVTGAFARIHKGSIGLGTLDLSKYTYVEIKYGYDGSDVTKNAYDAAANKRIGLTECDKENVDDVFAEKCIWYTDYEFNSAGWPAHNVAKVDLSGCKYNGEVFVSLDSLPGTFYVIDSIVFYGLAE